MINVECITEVTSTNGTVLFEKKKVYEGKAMGSLLIVKDESGCVRTIANKKATDDWNKDKWFKEHFKIAG